MSGSCGINSVEYSELLDRGVQEKYYWTLMTSLPQSARKLQNNKNCARLIAQVFLPHFACVKTQAKCGTSKVWHKQSVAERLVRLILQDLCD